jgi:hypothetical protein
MNPDVFLTIAFAVYAVVAAVGTGLLFARSRHNVVPDQAAENRLNGSVSTPRRIAEDAPGRYRRATRKSRRIPATNSKGVRA